MENYSNVLANLPNQLFLELRSIRCHFLKLVAMYVSPIKKSSPLWKRHKQNLLKFSEDNLKVDFSKVLFTDEARTTLNIPDDWSKGWVVN